MGWSADLVVCVALCCVARCAVLCCAVLCCAVLQEISIVQDGLDTPQLSMVAQVSQSHCLLLSSLPCVPAACCSAACHVCQLHGTLPHFAWFMTLGKLHNEQEGNAVLRCCWRYVLLQAILSMQQVGALQVDQMAWIWEPQVNSLVKR
jgi:hypothetical protein